MREDIDGAYVKIIDNKDNTIYITAVHKSVNRGKSSQLFFFKENIW